MVYQRRLLSLLTLFIVISLFVVACERPLGGTDEDTTNQNEQVDDPDVGGGVETGDNTDTTDGGTTDSGVTEGATSGDTTEGATGDSSGDTAGETTNSGTGETTTDTTGDTTTDSGGETQDDSAEAGGGVGDTTTDTGSETAAGDTTTDTAAGEATTTTAIPATHTVATGENLYRIGLKYGISWMAIATANNLTNPNILTVGQVLTLPGGSTPTPTPAPTPSPQTETTYIVQAGDNLYRIGLRFGISWVQIAEANGLVNPNMITVGSELKIPVNTPGPAPAFSHVVKPGETLFLISLQYGVAWPAIAEANNLTSPYVIYVGQTLQIPGS